MSKKKDCFGKYAVTGVYGEVKTTTARIRSKDSSTYTCRTERCPYMAECVKKSIHPDLVQTYKAKEERRARTGGIEAFPLSTNGGDLSSVVSS